MGSLLRGCNQGRIRRNSVSLVRGGCGNGGHSCAARAGASAFLSGQRVISRYLWNQRNISRKPVPVVEAGKFTDPSGAESSNDTSCASCKSALIVAPLVTTASTAGKQQCSKSLREPCDVAAKDHTDRLLGTASESGFCANSLAKPVRDGRPKPVLPLGTVCRRVPSPCGA
jgi:hypothetical protein